ncbi:uncharacterized protein LOC123886451 [Trifolium pratense]|uniref:Uncharacterized protein n=1 Tax=Trifolium pratense TaxID=57577 RepID=A0ACB0IY10_TRIPR|nr:uncharacterized protein LOC123886451 [Trifolium pratense]CAJ2637491.1 unnamed protein product [Trifolium pratense]
MSDSAKSSPTMNDGGPLLQQMVIDAIPLSTIPPTNSTRKSKKGKVESSKPFTMSELHIDPLPSSGVATPVANPAVENVIAPGKTSVNIGLNMPKSVKTLDVENPAISGNLGKNTNDEVAAESLKKTGPETHAASSVVTPDAEPNSADEEIAADKDVNENPDVIIVNETTVSDKSVPTNSEGWKRYCKKPLYGPPKPVSKVVPRTEEKGKAKKRKAPPTSDSEFEPETDNGSARWKFVYHRRLALERNLKEDILQCQSVVEAIEYAASPEYRQVFVRGKCVKFSPTVVNQYLQRNSDEVADLKVTDNEMIADLTEASRALEARKLKIDRVIEALKAEEAAETAEGEPDGQEGVETSGSDDMVEDSDESSSV